MKNNLIRRAALILSALLSLTSMSLTAYAQSSEPAEETAPETEEGTTAKPFTPEGTGTVVDNATDGDGKEFFTITTPNENIFYLVIDRQRSGENVYFLNAVTEADLMALAEIIEEPPAPQPEPELEPAPAPEPEPEPEKKSNSGMLLLVLGLALIGGGAGWYFKVYRPKQEKAAGPVEDYDEELEDYDDPGDDLPPWDEEDEYTEDDE